MAAESEGTRSFSCSSLSWEEFEQCWIFPRCHCRLTVSTSSVVHPQEGKDMYPLSESGYSLQCSLIAIMLGRLRMSIEETLKAYESLSDDIFGSPAPSLLREAKYSGAKFVGIVASVVREKLGANQGDATMRAAGEKGEKGPKVYIPHPAEMII
jgi:hypothetical protein